MSVKERRNSRVPRGLRLVVTGMLLLLVLAVPSAFAQDNYPDGNGGSDGSGKTTGQDVGGETFFRAPDTAGAPGTESGGGFAFTGANVLVLVVIGAALIGTGVWLRRRGRTVDSLE